MLRLLPSGMAITLVAVAAELTELRPGRVVAIEVRPVRGEELRGA